MASKLFINQTSSTLNVTITIREGSEPNNNGGTKNFQLGSNQQQQVDYGTSSNIYLNAMQVSWDAGGSTAQQYQEVTTRGSGFDNTLNTNSIITINSITPLGVSGSN